MDFKKILIFNPFGIGDVLFTTPLIRSLKESIEEVSLSYICSLRSYPLLKNNIFLDKVTVFEKDEWKQTASRSKLAFIKKAFSFFSIIKKEKFDIVFDLSMNSQYGFFLKCAGIKKRIGYNFKKRAKFLTHKIDISEGYSEKHIADYYLDLLKFIGIPGRKNRFDLFLSKESLANADNLMRDNGITTNSFLIGVCPGSGDSWGKTAYFKRWPQENFLELCEALQRGFGAKIVLLGSKAETSLGDYIYNNMKGKPVNLCAKISLEDFCAVINRCDIVITNDGGPFHIAQALDKKAICFFGPVDDKVYGSYLTAASSVVMTKNLPCRPCYKKFRFNGCTIDKKCLRDISVGEVLAAVNALIHKQ